MNLGPQIVDISVDNTKGVEISVDNQRANFSCFISIDMQSSLFQLSCHIVFILMVFNH